MKATKLFRPVVLPAALWLAGCVSLSQPGQPPKAVESAKAAPLAYYAEEKSEGRVVVLGDNAAHIAFLSKQDLPHTVLKAGAGPAGETVLLQADPKRPGLQDLLWAEYRKRNLYYAEEAVEGRIFVLGSLMSHYHFLRDKKLASGEEVEIHGVKATLEADPQNPALAARLKAQFGERHTPPAPPAPSPTPAP